jgi:hypothetical protein
MFSSGSDGTSACVNDGLGRGGAQEILVYSGIKSLTSVDFTLKIDPPVGATMEDLVVNELPPVSSSKLTGHKTFRFPN